MTLLDKPDPAALAASTAQGWTHALDTVARPAPEHLAAAQEAFNALKAADAPNRWAGVRQGLHNALQAARLRLDGAPGVTVDQVLEALERLRGAGLVASTQPMVPQFVANAAIARSDARIAELEAELAEAERIAAEQEQELHDELSTAVAATAQARIARDNAQTEARQAHERRKTAEHALHQLQQRKDDETLRRHRLWVLAQLGTAAPGIEAMPTDELKALETSELERVQREAVARVEISKHVSGAFEHLTHDSDMPVFRSDNPVVLAERVAALARTARNRKSGQRQAEEELASQLKVNIELRRELDSLKSAPLIRSVNAQAETIRAQRERAEIAEDERNGYRTRVEQFRKAVVNTLEVRDLEDRQGTMHQLVDESLIEELEAMAERLGVMEHAMAECPNDHPMG